MSKIGADEIFVITDIQSDIYRVNLTDKTKDIFNSCGKGLGFVFHATSVSEEDGKEVVHKFVHYIDVDTKNTFWFHTAKDYAKEYVTYSHPEDTEQFRHQTWTLIMKRLLKGIKSSNSTHTLTIIPSLAKKIINECSK